MAKTIGYIFILIMFTLGGFSAGQDYKMREIEVNQQSCELNVTGQIKKDGIFAKSNLNIYFNGLTGINGVLDDNNNGHFVGTYKSTPATADCSGTDQITCQVNFDGKTSTIHFGK